MALLLTVQTVTPFGSVALSDGTKLLGEISLNTLKTPTNWLVNAIDFLLERADLKSTDLDGFGVVVGPGTFTGLRVGLATVKGFALATSRPIVGVSSLRALAYQVPLCEMPVCALLDARKKEVYAGLFRRENSELLELSPERVIRPESLLNECRQDTVFIGEGAVAYRTLIVRQLGPRAHFVPPGHDLLRAGSASMLAYQEWQLGHQMKPEQVAPVYIRPSEAELNWEG